MAASDFSSSSKVVSMVDPDQVGTATGLTANEIDTKGFRYLHITIVTGTVATVGDMTVRVQDSDTSGGSFSNVPGAAVVVAAGADNSVFHGRIDTHRTGRYLQIDGTTGGTGTTDIAVVGVLYGCADSEQYVDLSSGGADELSFDILSV